MGKTLFSLLTVTLLGLTPLSTAFAQDNQNLDALRPCVPETQGRHLVESMKIIGEMPYQGGTLYHAVLGFSGQREQVQGEVAIVTQNGKCSLIYQSSYWGGGQELTEVFSSDISRKLAYQWLAHQVQIIGRDVIQQSLNKPGGVIPDHYLWAYKKLGFTVPNQ